MLFHCIRQFLTFLADLYTKDEQNLKKLAPTVGAGAKPMIASLARDAAGLETAKQTHNLPSAKSLLKDAETQKAELIPKLTNKGLASKFTNVLSKNKVLNQHLASGKGSFADIDNYMKYKDSQLAKGPK